MKISLLINNMSSEVTKMLVKCYHLEYRFLWGRTWTLNKIEKHILKVLKYGVRSINRYKVDRQGIIRRCLKKKGRGTINSVYYCLDESWLYWTNPYKKLPASWLGLRKLEGTPDLGRSDIRLVMNTKWKQKILGTELRNQRQKEKALSKDLPSLRT